MFQYGSVKEKNVMALLIFVPDDT